MTAKRAIIAAVADDSAIGRGNALPWHIREDLRFFKHTTTGNAIIMGWNTFLSIGGRPLPNRKNIVISSHSETAPINGVIMVGSLGKAFEKVAADETAYVIGGAKTYGKAMECVDTLYITAVHTTIPDADAFFPEISLDIWAVAERSETKVDPECGLAYEFIVYKRKNQ